MIVTVASYKGGVAKTTTAFHLASYLQAKGPTLLIDGDPNRSATGWAKRGQLPFKVVDERQAARFAKDAEHVVIDTQARPTREDLEALVEGCDLLVIPTTTDILAVEALMVTVEALRDLKANSFRILLTRVRGKAAVRDAREALEEAKLPVFAADVPNLVAFEQAALLGVPVSQVKDASAKKAWEAYEAVCREILP